MSRIPLVGGAYEAESVIANAQRCVNLYPERNPKDSPTFSTHYPTPGLKTLIQLPVNGPVRGLFTASNGNLYAVCGDGLFFIGPDLSHTLMGTIGNGQTPVSMADNRATGALVDGSALGYYWDLNLNDFNTINDSTGSFTGADKIDYLDTFFLFNRVGTAEFYTSLSNTLTFDPLYFATKTDYPDKLATLLVVYRTIWLLGTQKTEVWYDAGNPQFPFSELPGVHVEHGCAAKYSVASQDTALYWLSQDLQGQGVVLRGEGYKVQRISTHALELAISKYPRISDAIGYCYQQRGHVFYVLTFPTADATWVFDETTALWHQRGSIDGNGVLHRHRSNCHAFAYGINFVGDYSNGKLYALDKETYTDDGVDIPRIRSFPHTSIVQGASIVGQDRLADLLSSGNRVKFDAFVADVEVGTSLSAQADPLIYLRWSDTRGQSYGNALAQSLGKAGQYLTQPQWSRLGLARDRVFELSWAVDAHVALNGAYVDVKGLAS